MRINSKGALEDSKAPFLQLMTDKIVGKRGILYEILYKMCDAGYETGDYF